MELKSGTTLLFIGDSITDTGRSRPVGAGAGLGTGYVSLIDGLLAAHHGERKIRVLNTGVSGNRVIDLELRWQSDVIDLEPQWLSIMIGINDVWRHFDSPLLEPQVDIDTYGKTLRRLVARTKPLLDGLVLLSPYYLEPNRNDPMRAMMDAYGAVVREVASESGACFGDTQAAFDRFLESNPTQMLCGDRVHPNLKGHSIIASCFLDTIGFAWNSTR